MKRFFDKQPIWFAVVWIAVYVLAFGNADSLSETLGIPKLLTCIVGAVLTAVLVLAGLMFRALYRWRKASSDARLPKRQVVINWVIFLGCVGVSIWMQFAVQKSAYIPAWLCYMVMGVCAVGFGVTAHRLVFRSVKE